VDTSTDRLAAATAERDTRNAGVDTLKAEMTLLVVFHHTAITYGAIGGWFYHEVQPDGSLQSLLLMFFCTINQAYFMGVFFLIAGYFSPGSLRRKGIYGFLRERFIRLGLPLIVFGWVLGPITVAAAQTRTGERFLDVLFSLWRRAPSTTGRSGLHRHFFFSLWRRSFGNGFVPGPHLPRYWNRLA
jgi:fucose 4-O-acetylase-like acetyltransferase